MGRDETQGRSETGRALVGTGPAPGGERRIVGGRPSADFLTQLILGADPAIRPSRLDRTRTAVALYAAAAGRCPSS